MQNEVHPLEHALLLSREGDRIIYRENDGGSFEASADVAGPRVSMEGDDIDSDVDLGLPGFSLEDGSTGSEGRSFLSGFQGDATALPAGVVMPLILAGIALIVGAGALAWQRMFKAAGYAALSGASLIVMGQSLFWGIVILLGLAIVALWPLISAELEQVRFKAIAKPIMTGVEKSPDMERRRVKASIKAEGDKKVEGLIEKYKKKWNI